MKKPNIEDYIDIRVYSLELDAYIEHIENVNTDLLEASQQVMRIKDLWYPPKDYHGDEFSEEFKALNAMKNRIEKAILKATK